MSFQTKGFRQIKQPALLDITPLIDCIFQLLVFFLLTWSFITTPNLGVELPKASAKPRASQEQDLIVVVTRSGEVEFNSKRLTMSQLLVEFKREQKVRSGARVLIQADKKAYHGNVVKVMDMAKSAGFRRLGVAVQSQ